MDVTFERYLTVHRRTIEKALAAALPPSSTKPATLHRAMRYSLLDGGKRLRPILCLAAAEASGGDSANALTLACAVECIHSYSLVHDDLPCMDDDDFRRGKPTNHKIFGEGIAVLAGDALLTKAFELAAGAPRSKRYGGADYVTELAHAAGHLKLIAGQVADLEGEKRKLSRSELRFIHEGKTAALLSASIRLGAMSANASPAILDALGTFGKNVGLAFQVIDDILDITQTTEKLGKSAGKDITAQKATYPSVIGLDASRREAKRLTSNAREALKPLGARASRLHELADYLLARDY
jgi:geranylgeranyl diphosphate synthase type II